MSNENRTTVGTVNHRRLTMLWEYLDKKKRPIERDKLLNLLEISENISHQQAQGNLSYMIRLGIVRQTFEGLKSFIEITDVGEACLKNPPQDGGRPKKSFEEMKTSASAVKPSSVSLAPRPVRSPFADMAQSAKLPTELTNPTVKPNPKSDEPTHTVVSWKAAEPTEEEVEQEASTQAIEEEIKEVVKPIKVEVVPEPEVEKDDIKHPSHYEEQAIVIQPKELCMELDFCHGNVLKYVFRAGHKPGSSELKDLSKAIEYLDIFNEKNDTFEPTRNYLSMTIGLILTLSKNSTLVELGKRMQKNDLPWTWLHKELTNRVTQLRIRGDKL